MPPAKTPHFPQWSYSLNLAAPSRRFPLSFPTRYLSLRITVSRAILRPCPNAQPNAPRRDSLAFPTSTAPVVMTPFDPRVRLRHIPLSTTPGRGQWRSRDGWHCFWHPPALSKINEADGDFIPLGVSYDRLEGWAPHYDNLPGMLVAVVVVVGETSWACLPTQPPHTARTPAPDNQHQPTALSSIPHTAHHRQGCRSA